MASDVDLCEKGERLNIILIIMDAVRADHLSCYGYHRKTSPNIDKLAKRGVLFENAFSAAEWSPPSHASIFTGKYPSYHKTQGKDVFLHTENTTIAEILGSNGYQTFGVTSNMLLSPTSGFSKGFQNYLVLDAPYRSFKSIKQSPKDFIRTLIYGVDRYTYRNIEIIKRFISKHGKKRPFFLFSNLLNCHAPYDPPRPFKKQFCSSLKEPTLYIMEWFSNKMLGHTGEKICDGSLDIRKLNLIATEYGQYSFMAKELQVSQEEWEVVKSWYDGEISYLDHRIGDLISFLDDQGTFDKTFLIITSDHGDNFGQHGLATHRFCLYDSLLHVPLIMVCPDVIPKGKRISNLVSTVDIFPTILHMLKIQGYRSNIQGRSLFPFKDQKIHNFICAECGPSVTNRPTDLIKFQRLRPKLKVYDKGFKCLRTKSYKYIISSDKKEELYNIEKDPLEEVNIAGEHPEKVEYFRKQLENAVDVSFFGPEELPRDKESEEMMKRLKALGYV